jgi:predicted regulator of Ras-like GTPase activity (Roadblock/LC7/MglB family)
MKLSFFSGSKLPFLTNGAANRASSLPNGAASLAEPVIVTDPIAEKVIAELRADLPHLIVAAVVDTASGRDLAAYSSMASFDPHIVAQLNAEIVQKKERALKLFKLDDEQVEDIIVSTTSQYHIIKPINNGQKFIYLAVFAQHTGLGFAREVLRRHALALVA